MRVFKIISFLCFTLFIQPIYSSNDVKDEFREKLIKKGQSQIEAISSIKVLNREDFIPLLPEILRNSDSNASVVTAIILLYKSYGVDIDKYHPKWTEDFEWILENDREESNYIEIFSFIENRKERRLLYSLTNFLKYPVYSVRVSAYKALGSLNDDRAIPFLFELGNSENGILKKYYLESLVYFKDDRILSLLPKLMSDPSPAIRSECVLVIEKLNLKEKYYTVSNMANSDLNYEVRKYSVTSLKNLYNKNKTYIFQKTIFDENSEVRNATVEAIYMIRDPYYSRFISQAMEKEQITKLKLSMIETLIALGNHGGGGGLITTLKDDKSTEVRIRSAQAIAMLNVSSASQSLLTGLRYESQNPVKLEIVRALGALKEKNAVSILLDIIKATSPNDLRKEAILSLEKIDDPVVMPFLFDQIDIENNLDIKNLLKTTLREMLYKYHSQKNKK
ncbi:MAG: HEAT repeat domain-containing protein [Leptospiraceae bacterium]|nr:HEAT repeat domain-containing protein [Leptospiraceae bacterium]